MITHVKVGFKPHTYIVSIDTSDVPNTTKNALYNPHWLFVLQEKLNDLRVNHTWTRTHLPFGIKPIGCKKKKFKKI